MIVPSRRRRRWRAGLVIGTLVCLGALAPPGAADEAPDRLRQELAGEEAQLRAIDVEVGKTRTEADRVAAEIAVFDRSASLGPVRRAQYSRLKQLAQELADRLGTLRGQRAAIEQGRRETARRLLEAIAPEILAAQAAYTAAPSGSREEATLFERYRELVRERVTLQGMLSPSPSFVRLDATMDADDTADSLLAKADLLADVEESYQEILEVIGNWKNELTSERDILAEARRLHEENTFFRSIDPLDPGTGQETRTLAREVEVPESLEWARSRLAIPENGLRDQADFDRLLESMDVLEREIADEASRLGDKRFIMMNEAERRRGLE